MMVRFGWGILVRELLARLDLRKDGVKQLGLGRLLLSKTVEQDQDIRTARHERSRGVKRRLRMFRAPLAGPVPAPFPPVPRSFFLSFEEDAAFSFARRLAAASSFSRSSRVSSSSSTSPQGFAWKSGSRKQRTTSSGGAGGSWESGSQFERRRPKPRALGRESRDEELMFRTRCSVRSHGAPSLSPGPREAWAPGQRGCPRPCRPEHKEIEHARLHNANVSV